MTACLQSKECGPPSNHRSDSESSSSPGCWKWPEIQFKCDLKMLRTHNGAAHLCDEVCIGLVSPGVPPPIHRPRARALPALHGVKALHSLHRPGDHPRLPGHGLRLLTDTGQLRRALPALNVAIRRPERIMYIKLELNLYFLLLMFVFYSIFFQYLICSVQGLQHL